MSYGLSLKGTQLPEAKLAFTNKVYTSQSDIAQLFGSSPHRYADIKGSIFTLEAHPMIAAGQIALNKIQREFAKISIIEDIFVKTFAPPAGFDLGSCTLEVDFVQKPAGNVPAFELQEEPVEKEFRTCFEGQVFQTNQPVAFTVNGQLLKGTFSDLAPLALGTGQAPTQVNAGTFATHTDVTIKQGTSGKLQILSNKVQQRSIFRPDFNFEELGIGGLTKEFGDIFRRAFAARIFPAQVIRDLGTPQVRGMLLYGPPGTGKTLIARQLAKFLKAAEPKIINGPEVLNKYVGQSEENIRKLFADAEKEQKQQGENSQLHIIIFDEIDAICKARGSSRESSGVGDSIVNQLLAKIDGVDSLNNILLIGMTNRIDLIDEALLRPGRLEVHVEISLPDEAGRVEILNIHTKNMRAKGYLDKNVSIPTIAAKTKNFSGAELEGLVRNATSFALNRKVNVQDLAAPKDLSDIVITHDDFDMALTEIKPAFGQHTDDFEQCMGFGITQYSPDFDHVLSTCMSLVNQVRSSENTPLLSVLLHGPAGCGKTALSAHLAQRSDYPYVRRIANENYVGHSELSKVNAINKVFEDAYKSTLSMIVLDDLERLIDYVRVGPRFSNVILQALFSLLKKQPPKAQRRLLVIATTSDPGLMEETELMRAFQVSYRIPVLSEPEHFMGVLQGLKGFTSNSLQEICEGLRGRRIGIRTLLLVAEMAVQRQSPVEKAVFMECLQHAGSFD